nr:hypothetical protein [uncultured bacterium]
MAALLSYEHSLVSAHDLTRLNAAFFTMNGVISVVFFFFWQAICYCGDEIRPCNKAQAASPIQSKNAAFVSNVTADIESVITSAGN